MPYYELTAHFDSPEAAEEARRHFSAEGDTSGVWESALSLYSEQDPQRAPVAEVGTRPGCLLAYQSGNTNKYVSFLELGAIELIAHCLKEHNVVGLANLLRGELNAVQVWGAPQLLRRPWRPAASQQRRALGPADTENFLRAASALLAGKCVQDDQQALLELGVWSDGPWPEHLEQALEQKGYRRQGGLLIGPSHLD